MRSSRWLTAPTSASATGGLAEWAEDSDATIERFDLELRFPITIRKYLELAPTWNVYHYRDSRLPGAAEYRRLSLNLQWSWIDKMQR